MLINVKQIKNLVKVAGMQIGAEAIEFLNKYVDQKLGEIINHAKEGKVKRLRVEDFQTVLQNTCSV